MSEDRWNMLPSLPSELYTSMKFFRTSSIIALSVVFATKTIAVPTSEVKEVVTDLRCVLWFDDFWCDRYCKRNDLEYGHCNGKRD